MPEFEPALELNAAFYTEVLAPALAGHPHGAALLGWGSEILGFDSARSTDHGWGPRAYVFGPPSEVDAMRSAIERALPDEFAGWPVRYGWDAEPVEHRVHVGTLRDFLQFQLGCDPRDGMTTLDWLVMPQQLLLGATRGAVFHDGLGELAAVRDALTWHPDDVWRWMIACQWRRIASEEAFVGRTAEVGDELGSRLVAARLTRELMRLWFLLSRTYWPYDKWFGSAFAQLADTQEVAGALRDALAATDHTAREAALVVAYESTARRHNAAELTEPLDPAVRPYYARPFRVLMSERFVEATVATVTDPWLRSLALVGSVDQCVDSTDVSASAARARGLRSLYSERQVPDVHGRP